MAQAILDDASLRCGACAAQLGKVEGQQVAPEAAPGVFGQPAPIPLPRTLVLSDDLYLIRGDYEPKFTLERDFIGPSYPPLRFGRTQKARLRPNLPHPQRSPGASRPRRSTVTFVPAIPLPLIASPAPTTHPVRLYLPTDRDLEIYCPEKGCGESNVFPKMDGVSKRASRE